VRHTIDVLAELAKLNAATHAARKESERIEAVLNATARSIADAARTGKAIDPQDLRRASEYGAEKARNDRVVAAAKAQDTARRAPLVRELRGVTDDPASTYAAIVATLTERYGAPSAEPYLSGKDRCGWEVLTHTTKAPRWRIGRATFIVSIDERGVGVYATGDHDHFGPTRSVRFIVRPNAELARRIVTGEVSFSSVASVGEVQMRYGYCAPLLAPVAVALDVIDHCVRYSRNEECAFLDAQAIADFAEYRRRYNVGWG
jgi:hypothetical protein